MPTLTLLTMLKVYVNTSCAPVFRYRQQQKELHTSKNWKGLLQIRFLSIYQFILRMGTTVWSSLQSSHTLCRTKKISFITIRAPVMDCFGLSGVWIVKMQCRKFSSIGSNIITIRLAKLKKEKKIEMLRITLHTWQTNTWYYTV